MREKQGPREFPGKSRDCGSFPGKVGTAGVPREKQGPREFHILDQDIYSRDLHISSPEILCQKSEFKEQKFL